LREKLFVIGTDGRRRIADYAARGPLASWVRVAAVRMALDLCRATNDETPMPDEMLADSPAPGMDPELAHIRKKFRAEFTRAFEASLRALSAKERNLLRLSLLEGLDIDQIGAVYHVHRSTAARWIVKCRETLFADTKRRLSQTLRVGDSEFNSLMRVLDS